jgi:hypothetical protein
MERRILSTLCLAMPARFHFEHRHSQFGDRHYPDEIANRVSDLLRYSIFLDYGAYKCPRNAASAKTCGLEPIDRRLYSSDAPANAEYYE